MGKRPNLHGGVDLLGTLGEMCETAALMNTSRDSWMALVLPPDRYEPIEVRLPDNSVKRGVWTGTQWWSDGQQIMPQAWRPFQRALECAGELQSA